MRYGSLFSGYGGLDLAVEQALGVTCAWHCETDPACARVLATHWPDTPNLGDITTVDWWHVPPVDVLCGGSPCQDMSMAGARAGIEGDRSGLWAHMATATAVLRPALVIWENVDGARRRTGELGPSTGRVGKSANRPGQPGIARVCGDLASLGYDARWVTVAASAVGAPHRRERVFLVAAADPESIGRNWAERARGRRSGPAHRGDQDLSLLPTPCAAGWYTTNSEKPNPTPSLAGLARRLLPTPTTDPSSGNGHARNLGREVRLPTPRATRGGALTETLDKLLPTPRATDAAKGGPNQRGSSGDLTLPAVAMLPTPSSADADGGHTTRGDRADELLLPGIATAGPEVIEKYQPAIRRWERVLGRPAPPMTEPGQHGQPVLSRRFDEWLMGLPEGYVADVPMRRTEAVRMLGNGVVPQQALRALEWLLDRQEAAA